MSQNDTNSFFLRGQKEYFFEEEKIQVKELLNINQWPSVSIAKCTLKSGKCTNLHKLTVDEFYTILQGKGKMRVDNQVKDVIEDDVVTVPSGTPQQITNTGDIDLVFTVTCIPAFRPECYANVKE
eukprot:TRINITY_DN9668_c0_g1_i1.p1 TRINITY_DN9668_c0_g1~~TRINITY_DN9668_c0_g1_i1.p1  ORF type:complete len:125 (+),score=19.31 TRINITY_DN9668_c0_g1_i1:31-405(+)